MTNVTRQHSRRFSLGQTFASSSSPPPPPPPTTTPPPTLLPHQLSHNARLFPSDSFSRRHSRRISSHIDQVIQSRTNLAQGTTAAAKRFLAHVATSSKRNSSYSNIMPSTISLETARAGPIGGGTSGIPSHAQSLLQAPSPSTGRPRSRSTNSLRSSGRCSYPPPTAEKPIASSSGGALSMTIQLAEPLLFLQGFARDDYTNRTPAMLRGSLIVRAAKATKIKTITLSFKGRARTEWPEGIPPRKSEFWEEKEIMTHTWPFFNAQFPTAELGHCADSCRLYKPTASESNLSIASALARSASPVGLAAGSSTSAADRRLSLQLVQARSFGKGDSPSSGSVSARGYLVFQPGDYVYNFELPIEGCLPETIETDLGSVKYELEATIERSGAFRPKLIGRKDVQLIRCPAETSLESTEPIAISRTWEDQMHYDIVISGKSFPLGAKIPIAFKLTPLAKVRCHRIKIYITENIEYMCKNKKVHRIDPTKKVLLLEKRSDGTVSSTFPGSSVTMVSGGGSSGGSVGTSTNSSVAACDNLLGPLNGDHNIGPTEMEFNVQLPGCNAKEKDKIHFDTTYKDIKVHHWIKIVMRLSKADPNDPSKRRHFEISIDSPFHILSCKASQANTALPAYSDNRTTHSTSNNGACLCPPLNRRNSPKDGTTTLYSTGGLHHMQRPMHLIRVPSHNPPPFDADSPPPPLMTPPPQYETIVSNAGEALADYFARLADDLGDEDTDDEPPGSRTGGRARGLSLPLTPGGRVARSMDERRTWDPLGNPL